MTLSRLSDRLLMPPSPPSPPLIFFQLLVLAHFYRTVCCVSYLRCFFLRKPKILPLPAVIRMRIQKFWCWWRPRHFSSNIFLLINYCPRYRPSIFKLRPTTEHCSFSFHRKMLFSFHGLPVNPWIAKTWFEFLQRYANPSYFTRKPSATITFRGGDRRKISRYFLKIDCLQCYLVLNVSPPPPPSLSPFFSLATAFVAPCGRHSFLGRVYFHDHRIYIYIYTSST